MSLRRLPGGLGLASGIGGRGQSWSSYCTPLNLEVTQITGGNRLSWEVDVKCIDADGYEIWVSQDGGAYALLDTVTVPTVQFDDTTDYAGAEVTYQVRAYKGTSYGAFSDPTEIVIEPVIANLAATWVNDFARITFDGFSGWQTEIYESRDNTNWTLVTTLNDGTETYDNYTWQGTQVYFRARCKKVLEFGDYTASINIAQTPLVFKYDNNPTASFAFADNLGLPAGKTVKVSWGSFIGGNERYDDYTTTSTPQHTYNADDEVNKDPYYVKLTGDLNSITKLNLSQKTLCYGDLNKWIIPTGLTALVLDRCNFSGDISSWVLPSGLTNLRLYQNTFTGDLSGWVIATSASTVMYLEDTNGKNEFTAPPRGNVHQCEAGVAGLYIRHTNCSIAVLDAFLAWFNVFLDTNTPVRNTLINISGTGMGIPTGGNSNTDRLAILAHYVAAGFTCTITNNT